MTSETLDEQRKTAETYCLSSIKDRNDVLRALAKGLAPSHFKHYGALFSALLADESQEPWIGVMQSVSMKQVDVGLSIAELLQIEGAVPSGAWLLKHIEEVKNLSDKQKALTLLAQAEEEIVSETSTDRASLVSSLDKVRSGFITISSDGSTEDGDPSKFIDQCHERVDNPSAAPKLNWWHDTITRDFWPIEEHELVVIAARPACGKTVLACNQVLHTAVNASKKEGLHPAIFINAEMTGASLIRRMATMVGGVDSIGQSPRAVARYKACLEELRRIRKHMLVYDSSISRNIAWIEAKVALLCAIGQKPPAICIDYLQLLTPPAGTEKSNRERQVAELSRRLKLIAKDFHVPVILLSQINREAEKEDRPPRMSDLRESGAIEQDADRIIFLWRDDPHPQSRVMIAQAKLRDGPSGISRVMTLTGACGHLTPE